MGKHRQEYSAVLKSSRELCEFSVQGEGNLSKVTKGQWKFGREE